MLIDCSGGHMIQTKKRLAIHDLTIGGDGTSSLASLAKTVQRFGTEHLKSLGVIIQKVKC